MSEIKVNKISPRTACGTTTLGDSGDTISIPAGVSITNAGTASGFGATGAVSWNTTVKTSGFTAVAGEGYFCNTTSGDFTVNLPAGTPGAVVGFKDYANTFDTEPLTLDLNGSDKANGSTNNPLLVTEGIAVTFVYIDSTKGWLVTDSGLSSEAPGPEYIAATGGTITTVCTNYKVHTFTGPGTFQVTDAGNAAGSNTVDYFVVAGGGGASGDIGGGGGAGGFRLSNTTCMSAPQTSPLVAPNSPSPAAIPVNVSSFPITVGAGGAGAPPGNAPSTASSPGCVSTFSTISSAGGGGSSASAYCCATGPDPGNGLPGGSGGGAKRAKGHTGGTGNTPTVSPPQGNDGGSSVGTAPGDAFSGGGGGAGAAGGCGQGGTPVPASGGGGVGSFVVSAGLAGCHGTTGPVPGARYFSGGGSGGGSAAAGDRPTSGTVGGGGGSNSGDSGPAGDPGDTNTGGGGSAGGNDGAGGNGGPGIVMIRYKFQ